MFSDNINIKDDIYCNCLITSCWFSLTQSYQLTLSSEYQKECLTPSGHIIVLMANTGQQDDQLAQSDSVGAGKHNKHHYGSCPAPDAQHPGGHQRLPNRAQSPSNSNIFNELCPYTETDPLFPNGHMPGSKVNEEVTEKDPEDCSAQDGVREMPSESVRSMVLQILVPFLLAGLGTVSAGMLLDVVQVRYL